MSATPALSSVATLDVLSAPSLPAAVPKGDWLRSLLAWPARLLDRTQSVHSLPMVSIGERHRRLSAAAPPEGWLALQSGLATVGDEQTWTSFATAGGTALAVGGVHGPDRPSAYARFREETEALGITRQAVYPLREPDLDAARTAGFESFPIGVEAWVDLPDFTLKGKRFADLRQMRNRAAKRGVVVEEVDPAEWRERIHAAWNAFVSAKEVPWQIRWLSGGPVFHASWGHRTFVAHVEGEIQAFCTILPGPDGTASLDVMCRAPESVPGSMDGLLVNVLQQLREEGLQSVSLGPCPLAEDVGQEVSGVMGMGMRWAWSSTLGNDWFGFRRLATYKEKFRPRYEVVHLGLAPGVSMLSLYLVSRIWALGD